MQLPLVGWAADGSMSVGMSMPMAHAGGMQGSGAMTTPSEGGFSLSSGYMHVPGGMQYMPVPLPHGGSERPPVGQSSNSMGAGMPSH